MMMLWLIAFGAGAASALMVAAVATGSALAVPLFYLAPLPVLIAGLGWSHLAALVAASTAAVLTGLFFGVELTLAYVAGVGLPAYVMAYLALMARQSAPDAPLEWFPVGRLVLAAAVVGSLAVASLIPLVAGDFAEYEAALRSLFLAMLTERAGEAGPDAERLADLLVAVMPPAAAVVTMATQLVNLWLAAHVARMSGRLMRPWPDLSAMVLPKAAAALLAGAFLASIVASGFIGLLVELLAATLLLAFGLLGIAVVHAVTRGAPGRGLVIGTVWLAALALGWPFAALALLGLVETLFGVRARFPRKGGRGGPPAANDI
ncbi:membrane protein [Ancylobacter defluvii]|uniref:Membrane protein n=2 Tax=Ancylobacter defluvii TaxID=1282440 RepID=A0A9W6JYV2_9HYPH|nr:DUF2232 domain-containing protein [Ancylobacter defluvii]GLK86430.1 membrane protein [Ancylobacter defluvii]